MALQRFPALQRWSLDSAQTAMLTCVLLLTVLVYLRCVKNGFVFDDIPVILKNPYISEWSFLWKAVTRDLWWFLDPKKIPVSAQYHPLQNIWFGLAYHLFGTSPIGWHLLKIALHVAAVMLSFRLAQLLTGSAGAALLAAMLFAVLPVHAEPVVWAADVPEPLAAVFELGAFCLFIRRSKTRWRGIIWPLVLFAGALLSHESAVVFPVLIGAYVFLFETHDGEPIAFFAAGRVAPTLRRFVLAVAWSAPFLGVSIIYMAARATVLGMSGILGFPKGRFIGEVVHGRLTMRSELSNNTISQTLWTLPSVLVHYLKMLAIPWLVGPAHDVQTVVAPGVVNFCIPVAILVLLSLLGWLAFRNSPHAKLYLFCVFWWLVTLAPAFDLGQLFQLVADRYEYLPSFAFCVIVGDLAIQFARASAIRSKAVTAIAATVTVVYTAVLWRLEPVWHDDVTLFSRCVESFPDSPFYRAALGDAFLDSVNLEAAERELIHASRISPNSPQIHIQLAAVYARMHRPEASREELQAAYRTAFGQPLKAAPSKPVVLVPKESSDRVIFVPDGTGHKRIIVVPAETAGSATPGASSGQGTTPPGKSNANGARPPGS